MTLSFCRVYEEMLKDRAQQSPLMDSGLETKALQIVRAGKELRGDEESSFWDDFIQLLSNSEGVAELFGVSQEKVATWPHRIKLNLDQLDNQQQSSPEEEDTELVPTGDNGGVAATNQDPPIQMPQ